MAEPVQIVQFALSTAAAGGTQDVTIPGFGTPKAAIFIMSGATANGTIADDARWGWGFTDGTSEAAVSGFGNDNFTDAQGYRSQRTDRVITYYDYGNETAGFSFNSWITDGIRLDIDDVCPQAYLVTCILIGGDDVLNAKVGQIALGTGTSAIDVNTVGFEPTLVNLINIGYSSAPPAGTSYNLFTVGFGLNDGADTQRATGFGAQHGATTTNITTWVSNNSIAGQIYGSGITWRATIGDYDSGGFSITPQSSAGSDYAFYLALEFAASVDIDLFDMSFPASGNYAETTPGFEPTFGLISSSPGTSARNTGDGSAVGSIATTVFDGTNAYTVTMTDEDNAAVMVAKSLADDSLNILHYDGSTTSVEASSFAMDADGWDFTLSTNPASAVLGWGLAIAAGATAAIELGSSVAGQSDNAASISTPVTLNSTDSGSSLIVAALSSSVSLGASIIASATVGAVLLASSSFSVEAAGSSSVAANIESGVSLSSTSFGSGSTSVDLSSPVLLLSSVGGSASTQVALSSSDFLGASFSGSSSESVDLFAQTSFNVGVYGSSSATAGLSLGLTLASSSLGASSVGASLADGSLFQTSLTGQSQVDAGLYSSQAIAANAHGSSTSSAYIVVSESFYADALCSSSVDAGLFGGSTFSGDVSGGAAISANLVAVSSVPLPCPVDVSIMPEYYVASVFKEEYIVYGCVDSYTAEVCE